MQKVIVDTNILIRALLKAKSSDGEIFNRFLTGDIELYYSFRLLDEITRVLTYPRIIKKYHVSNDDIDTFLKTITTFGKLVYPFKRIHACRDPDDNELLSLALSIQKYSPTLISADKDLLVLKRKFAWLTIVTPQEFLTRHPLPRPQKRNL